MKRGKKTIFLFQWDFEFLTKNWPIHKNIIIMKCHLAVVNNFFVYIVFFTFILKTIFIIIIIIPYWNVFFLFIDICQSKFNRILSKKLFPFNVYVVKLIERNSLVPLDIYEEFNWKKKIFFISMDTTAKCIRLQRASESESNKRMRKNITNKQTHHHHK